MEKQDFHRPLFSFWDQLNCGIFNDFEDTLLGSILKLRAFISFLPGNFQNFYYLNDVFLVLKWVSKRFGKMKTFSSDWLLATLL